MSNQPNSSEKITCKNCETEFQGNFCPNCSQSIKDYEKPFGLLIYDLMGNMFAFDTRLWRTFKAVMFQPGKMAKEFIAGHRVKYMPPFRFYVFVSFVFFLLLNYSTNSLMEERDGAIKIGSVDEELLDSEVGDRVVFDTDSLKNIVVNELEKEGVKTRIDEKKRKKYKDMVENPAHYIPEFYKYLSWFLFLLMPIYGSFLWVFFRKSYRYYLGHLIFAINQHSFLFAMFILLMGMHMLLPQIASAINGWMILIIPVYSIIGGRRLYQRKWSTIFWRLFVIFLMYCILVLTGVVLAAVITFV